MKTFKQCGKIEEEAKLTLENYNNELSICEKKVDSALRKSKKKGKKWIVETVNLIIVSQYYEKESTKHYLSEMQIQELSKYLVETRILNLLNDISNTIAENLKKIINKFTFRECANHLARKMENNQFEKIQSESDANDILFKSTSNLSEVILSSEKDEIIQIKAASQLIDAFRTWVSIPYSKAIFKLFEMEEEEQTYLDEIVEHISNEIQMRFKKEKKNLFTYFETLISTLKLSERPKLQSKLSEQDQFFKHLSFEQSTILHERNKKEICNEFRNTIKEFFKFTLSPFIIDPILEDIVQEIYEKFQNQLISKKMRYHQQMTQGFEEVMKRIQGQILKKKQFYFLSPKQFEIMMNFIVFHIPTERNEREKLLFENLILYLFEFAPYSLQSERGSIYFEYLNNSNLTLVNQEFREAVRQFINLLETQEECLRELLLAEIYLAITNIRIFLNRQQVRVCPLFGILFNMRCSIAKSFEQSSSLQMSGICSFFSFLDSYFERKLIFNFGKYSENIFEKEGFEVSYDDGQTDYSVLAALRNNEFYKSQEPPKEIISEFKFITQVISSKAKLEIPKIFFLQKLSDLRVRSRNIIIAVSGFLSQDEDKQIKWIEVANLFPDCEVYTVEYHPESHFGFGIYFLKQITFGILSFSGFLLTKIVSLFTQKVKCIDQNPYDAAEKQACLIGKYLAHLIFEGNLFPNCTISFIGFSLGTQVISSCLQQYQNMITTSNKISVIGSVLMMGGVADISEIQQSNLIDVVSYKLFNCYSNKDMILNWFLWFLRFSCKPAGLNPIKALTLDQQKKIENHDLSSTIFGHQRHMQKLMYILNRISFPSKY